MVLILIISVFAGLEYLESSQVAPEFFVGVEMAYAGAGFDDVEILVDKVKNYTNLFVIGSPEISFNVTLLNEACDYIYNSGLHFIVLFTRREAYAYETFDWMHEAKQKYGEKFLGVYRYDEPGGNQLDRGREMLIKNATGITDASTRYTDALGAIIGYYLNYSDQIFTADYGLYWFDYKSKYSAVFAEFGWNHSREINVALCRGAATAYDRDWGAMITWTYDTYPYIDSPENVYRDMVSAYTCGAKYVVIFDYPENYTYGILTENHFEALERFWNYSLSHPEEFGTRRAKVAYVLPRDYGFGFRRVDDTIWGLFGSDSQSDKAWIDVNRLVDLYGFGWDVIYDEPTVADAAQRRYERLIFWNETI